MSARNVPLVATFIGELVGLAALMFCVLAFIVIFSDAPASTSTHHAQIARVSEGD